jgi:hypothetical protein
LYILRVVYNLRSKGAIIMANKITRRAVLRRGIQISVGGASLLALNACGGSKNEQFSCVDPEELSEGERSMRVSMLYTDASAIAEESCSGCAFFPLGKTGCGECELLGGPVSDKGRCDSWSARS